MYGASSLASPDGAHGHTGSWRRTCCAAVCGFVAGFIATVAVCSPFLQPRHTPSATYSTLSPWVGSAATRPSMALQASSQPHSAASFGRRAALVTGMGSAIGLAGVQPGPAAARPTGLSKPELLPSAPGQAVIDIPGLLTPLDLNAVNEIIDKIKRLYGADLRVLIATYPDTPGMAVFDYWDMSDGNTFILFVDPELTQAFKFEVGFNVDILAPNGRWWTSLKAQYGTVTARNKYGSDGAVVACVEAILDGLTRPDEMGESIYASDGDFSF
uniref:TPM domain-containing protein n=1 Tax=Eutreptiella gymnastica TaxID=73025 RepID=A0A7S1J0R7_9EUGL|mmetsp:Transcript_56528/g.100718  ORF Transcript_56528/g.100718 Transcript_56528/m.100718 type:complete len:271 (+) Transcript_56528:28-840(+)